MFKKSDKFYFRERFRGEKYGQRSHPSVFIFIFLILTKYNANTKHLLLKCINIGQSASFFDALLTMHDM